MNRVEALRLLTVLTSQNATDEEKHIAAIRLRELIELLLPE